MFYTEITSDIVVLIIIKPSLYQYLVSVKVLTDVYDMLAHHRSTGLYKIRGVLQVWFDVLNTLTKDTTILDAGLTASLGR